jgi:hypothetical protein
MARVGSLGLVGSMKALSKQVFLVSLDWLKGTFTPESPIFHRKTVEKQWFPLDFPFNQSNDCVIRIRIWQHLAFFGF